MEESESKDIERIDPEERPTEGSGETREGAEDEAQERESSMRESGDELPG